MVFSSTSCAVLTMKLLLFFTLFFSLTANGIVFSTRLLPRILEVKENEEARFSCHYSCSVMGSNSHTTLWILGDMLRPVSFTNSYASRNRFNRRIFGGLRILNVVDKSNCKQENGEVIHELTIKVSDAERWNRTPLQCLAQATSITQESFYSAYAVLKVEADPKIIPTTASLPTPQPCPSPVTVIEETTKTETITSYQVVTLVREVTVTEEVRATQEILHSTSSSSLSSSWQSQLPHPTNVPVIQDHDVKD